MNQDVDLSKIERNAFRATFQDGVYEISWGLLLLGLGCAPLLVYIGIPETVNIFVSIIPAILFQFGGKRYITVPRMGLVKFGPRRKKARKRVMIFSAFAVAITFGLVILTMTGALSGVVGTRSETHWFIPAVSLGVVLLISAIAYLGDFGRMYLLAILCGAGVLGSEFLHSRIGQPMNSVIGMGIPGVIMLVIGVIQMTKFVRKYPLPDMESLSEGGTVHHG